MASFLIVEPCGLQGHLQSGRGPAVSQQTQTPGRRLCGPLPERCGLSTWLLGSLAAASLPRVRRPGVARAQGPCFESFCDNVVGTWKGWSSEWRPMKSETTGATAHGPLGPVGSDSEHETRVRPIMRNCAACSGVVQGCADWVRLDRDQRGFVFFDCGSWSAETEEGGFTAISALQSGIQRCVIACKVTVNGEVAEVQLARQHLSVRASGEIATPPSRKTRKWFASRYLGFWLGFWVRSFLVLVCCCVHDLEGERQPWGLRDHLKEMISSWHGHGMQCTSRSPRSFTSTRVSWKKASHDLMKSWRGALEYSFSNCFIAVKRSEDADDGFWLIAGDVDGSSAKVDAWYKLVVAKTVVRMQRNAGNFVRDCFRLPGVPTDGSGIFPRACDLPFLLMIFCLTICTGPFLFTTIARIPSADFGFRVRSFVVTSASSPGWAVLGNIASLLGL
ncbi:unnamed protein product [Symbiodinium natans]|uniref:Uncharacterized protein n=1 Tax=Symbiodinium natans TaxID=878477 RepID=A0A812L470_9DINO|nr:unnamed protein product [Symbiodinium natans]